MGEGSDTGVGVPPGCGGKMFRAFDKKTGKIVVGDGTARRRQQRADDLHGQRQAVHRRRGVGGRSFPASWSRSLLP